MPINSKRIAKNTILLYVRMILLMAVTLYTSRVVLAELGVDDYGIYCLIGGIISLFSFISNSLINAMQRYFNVALGKKDEALFQRIYIMSFNIFVIFSAILFLIGETVGLWFVANKLNIPGGREEATIWVYQLSLVTLVVHLMRTPDNAAIIAYERMGFYAYLSIGEAVLKLGIVFLLQLFVCDKLILYVWLYFAATLIVNIVYKLYCNRQFPVCRYHFLWDRKLSSELVSFAGWSLLSNGTRTITMQGENIFLNQYHSVAVNSARGIASQVYNAVNTFLANFQTAFRPQLTQTYAAGEKEQHFSLLFRSSRFSFYLLLVLIIPISFNLDIILDTWLIEVPQYTKEFCVFVLLAYLADALATPLGISVYANGNIRDLQIGLSIVFVIQLVASFLLLKYGWPPYIVSINILISHTIHYIIYLFFCRRHCELDVKSYLLKVILPLLPIFVLSPILPYIMQRFAIGLWRSLLVIVADTIWVIFLIWLLGLDRTEKGFVRSRLAYLMRRNNG